MILLAKHQHKDETVILQYAALQDPQKWGNGYWVQHYGHGIHGTCGPLPTRARAEQEFLWWVGYSNWQEASEKAFQISKQEWLATHDTLESTGAEIFTI
jgi:hypothetical protein